MKKTYACIVTGEEKYIAPSILKKKIEKFGTEAEFAKFFILPAIASLLRKGQTVEEIRSSRGITDMPSIDPHILTKLKLVRRKKGIRALEAQEREARDQYLRSKEYKDKMAAVANQRANMSNRQYIEFATGGPSNCQVEYGGTCARPDIYLTWNEKACDGCNYYEHCLCYNKRLSTDKKIKQRKR